MRIYCFGINLIFTFVIISAGMVSKNPTTVMTANGEVLAKEEATVNIREFDLSVTVKLLEETPAVLSLGKLCEDHGKTYHWTSGQKTTSHQKRQKQSIAI